MYGFLLDLYLMKCVFNCLLFPVKGSYSFFYFFGWGRALECAGRGKWLNGNALSGSSFPLICICVKLGESSATMEVMFVLVLGLSLQAFSKRQDFVVKPFL